MAQGTVERVWLDVAGRRVALHVLELGLACCGVEVRAARRLAAETGQLAPAGAGTPEPSLAAAPTGATPAGTAPEGGTPTEAVLHVLVVAGTVTARLAPELAAALERVPRPRAVLAFGACTATGGPYWDSYAVVPGAHEVVPVDAWVAGCPPRPRDLLAGLEEVLRGRP